MKIFFYGGAKSVSGANYLLESSQKTKILIDCGLNQGGSYCEKLNYKPFPYNPKNVDAVLITHSHIDHIGRLPKLCKEGFRGKIFSTPPTKTFAAHLLTDSAGILLKEAKEKNKKPLYLKEDIKRVISSWNVVAYHQKFEIKDFEIEFYDAGHILGSAFIAVSDKNSGETIVFSGDLGNIQAPLIKDTEKIERADYALIESTYGNRIHEDFEIRKEVLEDLIEETVLKGGTLMIPSFAMERTQELLYEINELAENGRIPRVPIFIDSPLAIKITSVYKKYFQDKNYLDSEALKLIKSGDDIFNFPGLKLTLRTHESKKINNVIPPKVIIAGAGMSNGGRILHHESLYLSDPKSAILFIGYQAKGSLGRKILDGAKNVKIFGEQIPVRCRVKAIGAYSAHADQTKLLNWLEPMRTTLKKVFVVQGEEEQSIPLSVKIKDELAINAIVPSLTDVFVL